MILSLDGIKHLIIIKLFQILYLGSMEHTVFQIMERIAIQIMGQIVIYQQDIYVRHLMESHHS